jgi:HPt (histidine-containing phosphotransfer) domain-containing protein
MKSINYWPRPASTADTSENHFEQLRGAFYTRLRSDRARLATLSAELACTDANVTPVLEELRVLSHRICGAAAIFEAPEIGAAASTLEQALLTAISEHADGSEPAVWAALEALVNLLVLTSGRSAHGRR